MDRITIGTYPLYYAVCTKREDKLKTADIDKFLVWLADEHGGTPLGRCKIDLKAKLNEFQSAEAAA